MGPDTLKISMELHKEARETLCAKVRDLKQYKPGSYLYFEGAIDNQKFDTDQNYCVFRQVLGLEVAPQRDSVRAICTSCLLQFVGYQQ